MFRSRGRFTPQDAFRREEGILFGNTRELPKDKDGVHCGCQGYLWGWGGGCQGPGEPC